MRKAILSLLLACSILSGCAGGPTQTQAKAPRLIPPGHLTALADPPPPPQSGSMEDLYLNHQEAMRLYWQLRDRYQGLVEWLQSTGTLPGD